MQEISINEEARLTELDSYEIMNTPAEADFNKIVDQAAELFNTRYAYLYFGEDDKIFIKAATEALSVSDTFKVNKLSYPLPVSHQIKVYTQQHPIAIALRQSFFDVPFESVIAAPILTANGIVIGHLIVLLPDSQGTMEDLRLKVLKILAELVMQKLEVRITVIADEHKRDRFFHRVVHDLKSPVTSISLYAQLLCAKEMPAEKVIEMGTRIKKSVGDIEQKLNTLLA